MDPILASKNYSNGRPEIKVYGGLHYMKGNRAPYFSLTASGWDKDGRETFGGWPHEEIEKAFPGRFGSLAELHLSDIDGTPRYAEENGAFWLAHIFGDAEGMDRPQYLNRSYEDIARAHFRMTPSEFSALLSTLGAQLANIPRPYLPGKRAHFQKCAEVDSVYKRMARETCATLRPRWKREAVAAIEWYGLKVYGDAYKPETVTA